MVVKRILLAGGLALIFPALPSYAEVSAENSNAAHAEDPG